MSKRKLIIIICVAVIVISLIILGIGVIMYFASNKDAKSTTNSVTTTQQQTTQTTTVEKTTVPEPQGGWAKADISELAKNIEINGSRFSIPCTFGTLKNQLESEGWEGRLHLYEDNPDSNTCGFSKDNISFNVSIINYDSNKNVEDSIINEIKINTIQMETYIDLNKEFNICGITKNTTLAELESKYGAIEPSPLNNGKVDGYFLRDIETNSYLAVIFRTATGELIAADFVIDE